MNGSVPALLRHTRQTLPRLRPFPPISPDAWGLAALWLLATAYNLFKPYHIDDAAHLEIAAWISHHWLHPMRGLLNWSGVNEPIFRTNQPHLYFYLLAVWSRLFGFSEPAMHLLQSLAALAAILLLYRLARRRLGSNALWATAMVVLGPAFIVEQNLMVDVPLLAVWLAFFNPLLCDVESPRQTRRYVIAASACAVAILVKYSSLTLVPILAFSLVLERRRAQAWTLLIPAAAAAAWTGFNLWDYGAAHILTRPGVGHTVLQPIAFAGAWLVALGALTPLGFLWQVQGVARSRAAAVYAALGVGFLGLVAGVASGLVGDALSRRLLTLLFTWNAAVMLVAVVAYASKALRVRWWSADAAPKLYLILWIAGTSAFYVLFAPFIAARHLLLILPAVTLVMIEGWGASFGPASKAFGLASTLLVSLGLGVSDWRFADFYRREAAAVAAMAPRDGHRLWADGHWGWQWYAARSGMPQIDVAATPLHPGDLLAVADEVDHQPLRRPIHFTVVRADEETHPLWNLFCTGLPDTLYLSTIDQGPWSLTRHCVNHVHVLRVDPDGDEDDP
jgi:Dolichyl-phosphate-mannose-protein mannosyltransferase